MSTWFDYRFVEYYSRRGRHDGVVCARDIHPCHVIHVPRMRAGSHRAQEGNQVLVRSKKHGSQSPTVPVWPNAGPTLWRLGQNSTNSGLLTRIPHIVWQRRSWPNDRSPRGPSSLLPRCFFYEKRLVSPSGSVDRAHPSKHKTFV